MGSAGEPAGSPVVFSRFGGTAEDGEKPGRVGQMLYTEGVFRGFRDAFEAVVLVDGDPIQWERSLALRAHSPTGIELGLRRQRPGVTGAVDPPLTWRVKRSRCSTIRRSRVRW